MTDLRTRAFPLDDISVDKDGTGRTVTAYATVFDAPVEIRDQDGHYSEQIARTSFDKTIAERGLRFGVFFNHARTLLGTPSERFSMPLGTPVEVRADARGLLTRTRYNKTPLADDVLELIHNGDIRGQSFTGRMIQSEPLRGPFRSRNGALTTVTRKEIALKEYGPTPFPAYEGAEIVGVRSELLDRLRELGGRDLDEIEDDELLRMVRGTETATATDAAGESGESESEEDNHSRPAMRATSVAALLRTRGINP